jgi:hypothetical protein
VEKNGYVPRSEIVILIPGLLFIIPPCLHSTIMRAAAYPQQVSTFLTCHVASTSVLWLKLEVYIELVTLSSWSNAEEGTTSRGDFDGHSRQLGRQYQCGNQGCGCLASEVSLLLLHPKCRQGHPDTDDAKR